MTIRNSMFDGPHIGVVTDPSWLLAPLYARDCAGLNPAGGLPGPLEPPAGQVSLDADLVVAATADWPAWWAAATEFRPGPPAPRTLDLVHFSVPLTELWKPVERSFDGWRRGRPPAPAPAHDQARVVEHELLDGFAAAHRRDPTPRTLRILQIPVSGSYLASPAEGMLIVSADLRQNPDSWAAALGPLLPEHF